MNRYPAPWTAAKATSGHWALYDAEMKFIFRLGEGQDECFEEPKSAGILAKRIARAINESEARP